MRLAFLLAYCCLLISGSRSQSKPFRADAKGTQWKLISEHLDGNEMEGLDEAANHNVVVHQNKIFYYAGNDLEMVMAFKIDTAKKPHAVDLIDSDGCTCRGIYELQDDILKVCIPFAYRDRPNHPRPVSFDTKGRKTVLMTLKRVK